MTTSADSPANWKLAPNAYNEAIKSLEDEGIDAGRKTIGVGEDEKKIEWNADDALSKIVPSLIDSEKAEQALKIIDEIVLNKIETSKAELFIENVLLHYFTIPVTSRVASIIRKRYREKSKEANENRKRIARMLKGIKDLDIAEEFEGLYRIDEDEKTHRISVRPRFDQIAYTTIERVTTPITEVTGIYRESEEIVIPISKC